MTSCRFGQGQHVQQCGAWKERVWAEERFAREKKQQRVNPNTYKRLISNSELSSSTIRSGDGMGEVTRRIGKLEDYLERERVNRTEVKTELQELKKLLRVIVTQNSSEGGKRSRKDDESCATRTVSSRINSSLPQLPSDIGSRQSQKTRNNDKVSASSFSATTTLSKRALSRLSSEDGNLQSSSSAGRVSRPNSLRLPIPSKSTQRSVRCPVPPPQTLRIVTP